MATKPYEDEEDDEDDQPKRRQPRFKDDEDDDLDSARRSSFIAPEFYMVGKILLLIGGAFFGFSAFSANAVQASAMAGLGCLCGIASRICQAEEHFLVGELRRRDEEREARRKAKK